MHTYFIIYFMIFIIYARKKESLNQQQQNMNAIKCEQICSNSSPFYCINENLFTRSRLRANTHTLTYKRIDRINILGI